VRNRPSRLLRPLRLFLTWRGLDEWRAEACAVELADDGLRAYGVQLGAEYRLDYRLRTDADLITESLELSVLRAGGLRRLLLVRKADGTWTADDRPVDEVEGALDCDLAFSPLTNYMPAARLDGKPADHVMAWVSVPDLEVLRSEQRYEPIDEHCVRYVGIDHDFNAELELDEYGFVVRYPGLAERADLGAARP
jgi:uncharacterized protein